VTHAHAVPDNSGRDLREPGLCVKPSAMQIPAHKGDPGLDRDCDALRWRNSVDP
jgi:hypothetical protein